MCCTGTTGVRPGRGGGADGETGVEALTPRIGVLLERRTLLLARRGVPTYEQLHLYRDVALAGGLEVVLFSLDGLDADKGRVRGYAPTPSGWRRVVVPLPAVVHKRVLFPSRIERTLRRRHGRGVVFVNPPLMSDKAGMYRTLMRSPHVVDHLPLTDRYDRDELARRLDNGATVIIKPRVGSVGKGVARLEPAGRSVLVTDEHGTRAYSVKALLQRLNVRVRPRAYLLQQYIPMARLRGRPFDLRVPVQRDGEGNWVVAGVVAKVAVRNPFLTNLAQGGRALPAADVLADVFAPRRAAAILDDVRRLAIRAAQAVAHDFPEAADLGLDVGVDERGKAWLIEVNARDQRVTFLRAGMQDVLRAVYEHPLRFCAVAAARLKRARKGVVGDDGEGQGAASSGVAGRNRCAERRADEEAPF